jgi:hypothetical protein
VRANITSGSWARSRDRHLVRLRAAFADLDARLLVADAPPTLSDMVRDVLLGLWWRRFEDALPLRARIVRGRRIKITMLLAVMREARADGPVRYLVQSFARDLMERHATERVPEASGRETAGIDRAQGRADHVGRCCDSADRSSFGGWSSRTEATVWLLLAGRFAQQRRAATPECVLRAMVDEPVLGLRRVGLG